MTMKKRGSVVLTVALVAAVVIIAVMWCSFKTEINELKKNQKQGSDKDRSGLLTEALLYSDWVSDDYMIFEDGRVVSRKTFEEVYKLDLSHIAYMDGALCLSGSFVAVQTDEETVKVYDLSKGKEVHSINLSCLSFAQTQMMLSADGRYLVYCHGDDVFSAYDLSTGEKLRDMNDPDIRYCRLADSTRYAFDVVYEDAHSGWVSLYSLDNPDKDMIMEFEGRLCPIDIGGNFLVDIEDDTVLELSTGRWYQIEIGGYFEFSDNGRYLAVETEDGKLCVYDTQTWDIVKEETFVRHSGTIFIDEDRYMLACHYPDVNYEGIQTVNVYDTQTWTLVNSFSSDAWIEDLRNLKSTYVYDCMGGEIVNVLTSETIFSPYDFNDVELIDVDGPVMAMLLVNYEHWERTQRLLVFNNDTGEYYVNARLPEDTEVFISDENDYLMCNASGAYRFTFEDLKNITRIICD